MERNEALGALRSIDEAQGRLGISLDYPLWRHAMLGGLIGLFIGAIGAPVLIRGLVFVLTFAGIFWLRQADRKRVGTYVSGWKAGRVFSIALIALMVGFVAIERAMLEAGWSALWTGGLVPLTAAATATIGSIARWQSYLGALNAGARP